MDPISRKYPKQVENNVDTRIYSIDSYGDKYIIIKSIYSSNPMLFGKLIYDNGNEFEITSRPGLHLHNALDRLVFSNQYWPVCINMLRQLSKLPRYINYSLDLDHVLLYSRGGDGFFVPLVESIDFIVAAGGNGHNLVSALYMIGLYLVNFWLEKHNQTLNNRTNENFHLVNQITGGRDLSQFELIRITPDLVDIGVSKDFVSLFI